jgi:hypothetical protein
VIQLSCRIDTEAVMGKPYSQDLRERVIAAVDTVRMWPRRCFGA